MQEIDRTRRVSEVLRRELATLIRRELNDSRISSVSVNAVKLSKDLKNATIYVSSMEGNRPQAGVAEASPEGIESAGRRRPVKTVEQLLNNASKYLRHLLSQSADLRVTPSLRFKYDDSIQRGVEMSSLIDSLKKKDESG